MALRRQILIILYLECILAWSLGHAACNGVEECSCEKNSAGENLILCRTKNLMSIPHFTESSETIYGELNLEGNVIDIIPDDAFKGIKFKRLLMHGNIIKTISDRAFVGLETSLEELSLTFDPATEIASAAFTNLANLKVLNLEDYGKSRLPPNALSALVNLEHLTMSPGALNTLVQSDFAQLNKLSSLNIGSNQFIDVPSCFKTPIGNLSMLRMDSNGIRTITRGAFQGLQNLQILDLSQNSFQLGIDRGSFNGLEKTLRVLSCRTCLLTDYYLPALGSLRSLRELDVSDNAIESVDKLLVGMSSLQILDIHKNKVTTLYSSMFSDVALSLQYIDLSENSLSDSVSTAFASLKELRELHLNDISNLHLEDQSFVGQQSTLKSLSLSGVTFTPTSRWFSAIGSLTALETLVLSKANIQNIPDFMFQNNNHLWNVDLSNNDISSLSQRSLAGIQSSLVRIVLDHNQITTINGCVFHQFTRVDYGQIGLINNPLKCDCSIKWLYDKLKPHISQMEVRCDDNNAVLSQSSFFDSCAEPIPVNCENLLPSTTVSDGSIIGQVTEEMGYDETRLLSIEAIIGISLGIAVVIVIVILALIGRRASQRRAAKAAIKAPVRSASTKRFVRQSDPEENPPDDTTAAIVQTLGQMSDEEKYRLVNLLTNSSSSLDRLDNDGLRGSMRSPKGYVGGRPYQKQPSVVNPDQHVYEEIPGEHYVEEKEVQQQQKRPPSVRLSKHPPMNHSVL